MAIDYRQKLFLEGSSSPDGSGSISVELYNDPSNPNGLLYRISATAGNGYQFSRFEFSVSGSPSGGATNPFTTSESLNNSHGHENPATVNANDTTRYGSLYYSVSGTVVAYFVPVSGNILCSSSSGKILYGSSGKILYEG